MRRGSSLVVRPLILGFLFLSLIASNVGAVLITKTFDLDQPDITSPVQILNGLSAQAVFTLNTASAAELLIELTNTSTGLPAGFSNADQLLTSIAFDFGHPGYNGDAMITTGTVVIGPNGYSIDFEYVNPQLDEYDDVGGEWGYGNEDGTGLLTNFVSANKAQATRLPGANLDGPPNGNIDGPQGGIVTGRPEVDLDLGGLGAVADSVIITLTLDRPLADLNFLDANGVMAEFGSDAAFLTPEPTTMAILLLAASVLLKRRRQ